MTIKIDSGQTRQGPNRPPNRSRARRGFRHGVARFAAFASIAALASIAAAGAAQFSLNGLALGTGNATVGVQSFQSMRFAQTIHQEYDFSCGSAALATLLTYAYAIPTTEHTVFVSMIEHGDKSMIERYGFSLLDIKEYLGRQGIPSGGFRAPLAKLAGLKIPAIVLINVRGYRHFVVLRSVEGGRVLLSDPALGTRAEDVATFKRQWSGIFFIVLAEAKVAQKNFASRELWKGVPPTPVGIARYMLTLGQLQQVTIPIAGQF